MAYLQSPGLQIVEKNISSVTTGLSSTTGAYVGTFNWGPVNTPMLLGSETELVKTFGQPDTNTYSHFFSVANFLAYSAASWVVRAETPLIKNATTDGTGLLIKNIDSYETSYSNGEGAVGTFAARYPGAIGNGLKVSMADSATFANWEYRTSFSSAPGTSEYVTNKHGSNDELHIAVVDSLGKFSDAPGTVLEKFSFVSKAKDAVSYTGLNNYYADVLRNQSEYVYWMDHCAAGTNWGNNAANTIFTSLADTQYTSMTGTAASCSGNTATVTFSVQGAAPFIVGEPITVSGFVPVGYNGEYVVTACTTTSVSFTIPQTQSAGTSYGTVVTRLYDFTYTLSGGVDDNDASDAALMAGWDLFNNPQTYDASLMYTGNASRALGAYVAMNVVDKRRDCICFTSITATATGRAAPIFASSTSRLTDAVAAKTFDSSYAVIDSGYKYMYDKYNDKYRWIALNADIAGLCARVDMTSDAWFSPAGIIKGQIKGVIKLSWNPTQAERDVLYPAAINPVITWSGQGTMLYGDKTATLKPSAFDRINVRRLFLILEQSISNSAKYNLFEINDQYTRLQFVASVEPFLRDVKGRRGLSEFKVICDDTNNTSQIISTNQFVGTILVKPLYSINYITLNFTAVGPNVTFDVAAGV
jgi:hypothetical protein